MAIDFEPVKPDKINFEPVDAPTDGTWPGEIGRALSRTGRQIAAAGPGAVAGSLSLGERLQRLEWNALNRLTGRTKPFPEAPVERVEQAVKRPLRKAAQNIYRSAEAPELAPRKGGVGGFLVNTVVPAAGYMGVAAGSAVVAGPAGPFVFGTLTGGEAMYQEATQDLESRTDLTPDQKETLAETERLVFGPVYGAIEQLQAGGVLKAGKPALRVIIQAARQRAIKEVAKLGGKLVKDRIVDAAWEGVEEALQEATQIGAATIHGRMPEKKDIRRVATAFGGGTVAGGLLKGAKDIPGGLNTVLNTAVDARTSKVLQSVTEFEQANPSIVAAEEWIDQWRSSEAEPSVGAETATKPRMRIEGELKDVALQESPKDATQPDLLSAGASQLPISTRNVDTAAAREEFGLPPRTPPIRQGIAGKQRVWAEQAATAEEVKQIAENFASNPRALTPTEEMGFRDRINQLLTEHKALSDKVDALSEGHGDTKDAIRARADVAEAAEKLIQVAEAAGSQWKDIGHARQNLNALLNDETSEIAMARKAENRKGDKLTPSEKADVETKVKKLREATQARETARRPHTKRRAERATRLGRRRYQNMTEAQKDAEVADILRGEVDDAAIRQLVENYASRPDVADFDVAVDRIKQHLPDVTIESVADSVVNASQRRVRTTNEFLAMLSEIASRQPRRNNKLRTDIEDFRYYIDEGLARPINRRVPKTETEANQKLLEIRDQVRAEYEASDARAKQKLERELASIEARIANKDFEIKPKKELPLRSPEVENLAYQVVRARNELRRRMAAFNPWYKGWSETGVAGRAKIVGQGLGRLMREIQAHKSSIDIPLLRQGGIAARSHPIRTLRRLPAAIRAFFNADYAARINDRIINGENSWYYHRAGLEFTDPEGGLEGREELFAASWLEGHKYLGTHVRASNRAFSTLLNVIRADSFDAMSRGFGAESMVEAKAIAAYVNVMTGRGSMAGLEKFAPVLNGYMWSPRFTLSRWQYRLGLPLLTAPTRRVRLKILREYAQYLAGLAVTGWLYEQAFGGKVSQDHTSSDYGKLVVGNTRLDPMSGLSQVSVLLNRLGSGKYTTAGGKEVPMYGPDRPIWGSTRSDALIRHLRMKANYGIGLVWSLYDHEDAIGQPTTFWREAKKGVLPMAWEDVFKVMEDQGVPRGLTIQALSTLSEGVQVYEQQTTGGGPSRRGGPTRRRIRR